MPGIDFRQARAGVPLAEVLALLDFEPTTRQSGQVRGPCPVHGSRTPRSRSFAAHLAKNVWHCFRCGAGGNALDLWAKVTRQPLHAAVIDLYTQLGREIPWLPWRAARRKPSEAVTRLEEKPMPEP